MNADILILNSSPRPKGNSAYLADLAAAVFAQEGVSHEAINVARLTIKPCTACDACVKKTCRHCIIKDDMAALYDKVLSCKAMLFASPIYWFTYSAQLKLFVDRLYGLWNQEPACFEGKKIGGIFVYGDTDVYSSGAVNAISTVEHMMRYTKAEIVGFAYGTASEPGDAAGNPMLVDSTKDLAGKLARSVRA
jgi:multimeric flavodoxin WrbA